MQVSEYIEFMDSLNPNDRADQSSLWDLAKTVRNAYALPSLGEFKDFFDDFTYFVQKKVLWELQKFSLNRQYNLVNRTRLIVKKKRAVKRDAQFKICIFLKLMN